MRARPRGWSSGGLRCDRASRANRASSATRASRASRAPPPREFGPTSAHLERGALIRVVRIVRITRVAAARGGGARPVERVEGEQRGILVAAVDRRALSAPPRVVRARDRARVARALELVDQDVVRLRDEAVLAVVV
eukprot:6525109-Prymnesium_polylepis.1